MKRLKAEIEAMLFVSGKPLEIEIIRNTTGRELNEVRLAISEIKEEYSKDIHGIELIELENSIQFCTKRNVYETLLKLVKTPKKLTLSSPILETLAIIAYKQPVTKADIDEIRGVKSDHALGKLLELELIEEVGRISVPGRPIVFGTTENFLRAFGLSSIEKLSELKTE